MASSDSCHIQQNRPSRRLSELIGRAAPTVTVPGTKESRHARRERITTAGTGGMLTVAEERLHQRNPDARMRLYGQEINDQSYAICKSDMIVKGQDANNIRLGDTLREDLFFDRTFDFGMSNPPFGVDWRSAQDVRCRRRLVPGSRFSHGLPSVGDGAMLFLCHLAAKMRPVHEGGGRAGIILSGSPLFNGAAESGPLRIRQWLEEDLVEAIIALPTNMFYNTPIATYHLAAGQHETPRAARDDPADRRLVILDEDAQEPRLQGA